jgi:hypothetical protein
MSNTPPFHERAIYAVHHRTGCLGWNLGSVLVCVICGLAVIMMSVVCPILYGVYYDTSSDIKNWGMLGTLTAVCIIGVCAGFLSVVLFLNRIHNTAIIPKNLEVELTLLTIILTCICIAYMLNFICSRNSRYIYIICVILPGLYVLSREFESRYTKLDYYYMTSQSNDILYAIKQRVLYTMLYFICACLIFCIIAEYLVRTHILNVGLMLYVCVTPMKYSEWFSLADPETYASGVFYASRIAAIASVILVFKCVRVLYGCIAAL